MEYINLKFIEPLKLFFSKRFVKQSVEDFDISEIYTTLSEAREEVWRRWNDEELRKKVEKYLGEIPEPFRCEPRAVFARHLITPNFEYSYFNDISELTELKKLGWEYLDDNFYTINPEKLHLGKIQIFDEDCNGYKSKKIVDFKKGLEGKKISSIETVYGKSLVDFHHDLHKLVGICDMEKYDASHWYNSFDNTIECYKHYLSFFICFGILFENFLTEREDEKNFTKNVVIPAYKDVCKHFKLKPLIVPLISRRLENDLNWLCYDKEIGKRIGI